MSLLIESIQCKITSRMCAKSYNKLRWFFWDCYSMLEFSFSCLARFGDVRKKRRIILKKVSCKFAQLQILLNNKLILATRVHIMLLLFIII